MERYANLSGDSDIVGYEVGADFIRVQFEDGGLYLYSYASTGASNVERMKALAKGGEGLNGYIGMVIRNKYARREC